MKSSRSSGSHNGDGFYPKSPETQSTDEEKQNEEIDEKFPEEIQAGCTGETGV